MRVENPKHILVYHIGSLGDTLVSLPALITVRQQFPNARITLLHDRQMDGKYVSARDVLDGAGVVNEFIAYEVTQNRQILNCFRSAALLWKLRRRGHDVLIYLIRAYAGDPRVDRDLLFFRLAGLKDVRGADGLTIGPKFIPERGAVVVPRLSEQLLMRLAVAGIAGPEAWSTKDPLRLSKKENDEVEAWLNGCAADGGASWLAVCTGTKHPVNRWPEERLIEVVTRAVNAFGLWPVVFGGPEDVPAAKRMISAWGRGHIAAGHLSVRGSAAALRRCVAYLGSDSGPMHLAASVGVRCVAIFSGRNFAGEWFPFGSNGHKIVRHHMSCEACQLSECHENGMQCMLGISVEEVWMHLKDLLLRRGSLAKQNLRISSVR